MSDAEDLIRRRKQLSKTNRDERIIEDREIAEQRSDTGRSYKFAFRNPTTGDTYLRATDGSLVRARAVSNSDPGANPTIQITDSGLASAHVVNFRPSPIDRPEAPQPAAESSIGLLAYLLDTVVQGDIESSCKTPADIWGLYAVVQWVVAPRVMVLFSFPRDNAAPVPYTCPRYELGRQDGASKCLPTADPTAEYATYAECRVANPISCPDNGSGIPPGTPLDPDTGYPLDPSKGRVSCSPNYGGWRTYLLPQGPTGTYNLYTNDRTVDGITYPEGGALRTTNAYLLNSPSISNIELIDSVYSKTYNARFYDQFRRSPRCGDKMTITVPYVETYFGGRCRLITPEGETLISHEGNYVRGFKQMTITVAYQRVSQVFLDWVPVTWSRGCGDYSPLDLDGDPNEPGTTPSFPPPPPPCYPDEGVPTEIKREFWIGGHQDTPIKLMEINEEEDYEWFGTLTQDGYIVTIKHGREVVDGVEKWCKVSEFNTSSTKDWRTEAYQQSKDLNPSLPAGGAGTFITSFNDRGNIGLGAQHLIDPSQQVTSLTNGTRRLDEELLVRPPSGSPNINAKLAYTKEGEATQQINVSIYRIDSVIPTNLNEIVGGCVEIRGVDFKFSPLFLGFN